MPKHSLKVRPYPGIMPSRTIVLACVNCSKFLEIERGTMEAMLVNKSSWYGFDTPKFITWSYCPGRPLTY